MPCSTSGLWPLQDVVVLNVPPQSRPKDSCDKIKPFVNVIWPNKIDMRLKLYTHIASEHGLSSVTTLVVGTKAAAIINPPLLLQDAHAVIAFIRSKTTNPLTTIFVSNHHSDHYFGASLLLEAFPTAKLLATPYVATSIENEYEGQIVFWSKMVGSSSFISRPSKPEAYEFSFFVLPGDMTSPIVLLGPVQGSSPNNTLFWLPTEQAVIAGDVVFARTTHVAVEEIDNSVSLAAWRLSLDLIYSLDPLTIVTGHIEKGIQFDAKKDMEHMYRYLDLFEDKIIRPVEEGKLQVDAQDLFRTFKEAFPNCQKNLDYFLGRMADKFGDGPPYKREGNDTTPSTAQLEGFVMGS